MKILVNLSVPAISQSYDIFLPDFMRAAQLVPLIVSAVEELSDNMFISSHNELICFSEKGTLLDLEMSLKQSGVRNGDHLILI